MQECEELIATAIPEHMYKGLPVPLDIFMLRASNHYYNTRNAFGHNGDFVTAPEVSQMFGEVLGIWLVSKWIEFGHDRCILVEVGAGNGIMMADILRATAYVQDFHSSIKVLYIVETSEALRRKQAEVLAKYQVTINIAWVNDIAEIDTYDSEHLNIFCVNNEFFDALPIKQYTVNPNTQEISEIFVDYDNNRFIYNTRVIDCFSDKIASILRKNGGIYEDSIYRREYLSKLTSVMNRFQKAAILSIDYGYTNKSNKSTIQAVFKHQKVEFLEFPGIADVTSLVDMWEIHNMLQIDGYEVRSMTQRQLLLEYGIGMRAKRLLKNGANAASIETQLDKLLALDKMGCFKAIIATKSTAIS